MSCQGAREGFELAEDLAGDEALQAPFDLPDGLALGEAALDVALVTGSWHMRTSTIVWIARLSWRSPERLKR